jgi:hypothetical protein
VDSVKVKAEDLHRMAYNAIQFSDKDSSVGGVTLWATGNGMVECWATDDYVALRDQLDAGTHETDQFLFGLELKNLKDLEKHLRDTDAEVGLTVDAGDLVVNGLTLPVVDTTETMSPVVKIIEQSTATADIEAMGPFAIRQNRFTKFRLLKTPGEPEYPVDFTHGMNPQGTGVLLWKLGPHLRGIVGQVDRGYLAEYFADESGVLW